MLRHTAFFMLKEGNGAEETLWMTKGSAYMRFLCPSVRALDFGTDLFGGSTVLAESKPWKRTPRWRSRLDIAAKSELVQFVPYRCKGQVATP